MRGFSRLVWNADLGWVVEVETLLSAEQLRGVCDFAILHQVGRYRSLPPGAKKDELAGAIRELRAYRITQRLVSSKDGTGVLFRSDKGTGKIISIGGI
jgi:hypothetical protein